MKKFIPYEKLSKRKKKEIDATKRGSWGALNPTTRKPKNPKAYNRKKTRKWIDEDASESFLLLFWLHDIAERYEV